MVAHRSDYIDVSAEAAGFPAFLWAGTLAATGELSRDHEPKLWSPKFAVQEQSINMSKQAIFPSEGGAFAGAPYTPGVKAGNTLYISGQLGLDPETKKPFEDFEKQVEGCIAGVRRLCEAAGGSLDNVVKTTVFLTDLGQFATLNTIYAAHFGGEVRPARSTFQVAALPAGAAVEIEAIAVID